MNTVPCPPFPRIVCCAMVLAFAAAAHATTYYVSPDGDGSAPTAGFTTGFSSVCDAVETAAAGDTVLLDTRTFTLTKNLTITNAITLCGVGGNADTIIDGADAGRIITLTDKANGALLHTFTVIRMGSAYAANLGIKMQATGTLSNLVVRNNGNTFSGNARYPIEVTKAGALVTHCWITNNIAPNNAGVILSGAGTTLQNCYIAFNSNKGGNATWPGIVVAKANTIVRNCTIVNNKSGINGAITADGSAKIYNNIIYGNTFYSTADANNWTLKSTADNWYGNCTYPLCGSAENGNFAEDPLLQDDAMHFYSSSPCNHQAVAQYAAEYDIEGTPRGAEPSVGAFEYVAPAGLSCVVAASDISVCQPDTITLSCTLDGSVTLPLSYAWDFDGDGTTDSTLATPTLSQVGAYVPSVTVTDAGGATVSATYTGELVVFSSEGRVYVTAEPNENAKAPYATWATAAPSIKDGMTYLQSGMTMILGDGTHYISGNAVEVKKPVTISSLNGAGSTFIARSSGSSQLFTVNHADAVLEGFTVEGGSFKNWAVGAIICIDSGTVRDCRFLRNTLCGHGAVTPNGSNAKVERCVFIGNYANDSQGPAAVKLNGNSSKALNCLFVCNTNKATAASYQGGALLLANSSAEVRNCTFAGNVSWSAVPAGIYNSSGGYVHNCISYGNMDYADGAYTYSNGVGTNPSKVSHSLVYPPEDTPAGLEKMRSDDPHFRDAAAGDYTLSPLSRCINAGTNLSYTASSIDLSGNPRIYNFGRRSGIVDLGCYEYSRPLSTVLLLQ